MENKLLTPIEAKTMQFLRKFIADNGCSPTFKQISKGIGKKKYYAAGISAIVNQLQNKKKIDRIKYKKNSIWLVENDPRNRPDIYQDSDYIKFLEQIAKSTKKSL
jgi:SOS-response transcriptional repressor LexA|tara:strand:- start:114 stop:428 length:315 start_codon:yes stop_codon:yes gene_type:complete